MSAEKYYQTRHIENLDNSHFISENLAFPKLYSSVAPTLSTTTKRCNDGLTYPTADRRASHNAQERQRREHLNTKFQELAHYLPSLQTIQRPSKFTIVIKSLEFVSCSIRQEENLKNQIAKLCEENKRLRKQAAASGHILRANLKRSAPRLTPTRSNGRVPPQTTPNSDHCQERTFTSEQPILSGSNQTPSCMLESILDQQNTESKCAPEPMTNKSANNPATEHAVASFRQTPPSILPISSHGQGEYSYLSYDSQPMFTPALAPDADTMSTIDHLIHNQSTHYPTGNAKSAYDEKSLSTLVLTAQTSESNQTLRDTVGSQNFIQPFAEFEQYAEQCDPYAFPPPSYSHAIGDNAVQPYYNIFAQQTNADYSFMPMQPCASGYGDPYVT